MKQCSAIEKTYERKSDMENSLLKIVSHLITNITRNYKNIPHDADIEAKEIMMQLELVTEVVDFALTNKKVLKMLEKVAKKELLPREPPPGFVQGEGFSPGNGNHFGNGFGNNNGNPFGNGFGNNNGNPFGNGFGSNNENPFGNGFGNNSENPFGNGFGGNGNPFGTASPSWNSSVPWWLSTTPPPFWNSTWNNTSPWWTTTSPPPFWNSTSDWNSSSPWWTTSTGGEFNSSIPWWASTTTFPPFWNSTEDWNSSSPWWTTTNWGEFNSSIPWWASTTTFPPFWNSTEDWNSSSPWWTTTNWGEFNTSIPWWASTTSSPFWSSTTDWNDTAWNSSIPWWASTPPPFWNTSFEWNSSVPWWQSSPPPFWNTTDVWNRTLELPDFKSMNKEELEQYFQSLEDIEVLNKVFSSIDENTLWDLYGKMNGTELGFLLEDIIYDDGNSEEADSWDTVFGDYGDFFRRKRSTEGGREMGKRKMKDMDPEEMKTMMSMGLSGLLMMEPEELDLPRQFRDVPTCLKEILWESEEESRICSILPRSLKNKIREIMLKVLKQDFSTKYFTIDWEKLDRKIDNDDIDKLVQKALSKISMPLNATDISEIVNMAKNIWLKIVNQETDAEKKKILNLVTGLFRAIDDNDIYSNIARIANKIQGKQIFN